MFISSNETSNKNNTGPLTICSLWKASYDPSHIVTQVSHLGARFEWQEL